MFLRKQIIESLLTDIYTNNLEICGNLEDDSDTHELKILYKEIGKIDAEQGRNLCLYPNDKKGMSPYLYHTHPYTAYAYPSFEDLWTVVKERESGIRFSSFIFTIWGVWILMPSGHREIDESKIAKIKEYYEKQIYEFHSAQKGVSKSKKYDSDIQILIDTYIGIVEKTFKERVSVRFVKWDKLKAADQFYV
jgi:hypothetical protein